MADKESLTGIEQDVQIEERTKHAMENYSQWLQNAMSASPWGNTELNKKLLSHATENVTTAVGLVQKLSRARNLEEVVKIQTEFISNLFQRADKSDSRNLHQSCAGRIKAFYLIGIIGT